MAGLLLSPAEKVYILDGIQDDCRSDGRSNTDYRPMELETDVVSHASGSARLRLANTDILVGIKTEIDIPSSDKPDLGKIEFFVDCSANATPEFEGRGGEQLASSISSLMERAYHSSQAFNLKQLCIFEGKQCWKLYVDILTENVISNDQVSPDNFILRAMCGPKINRCDLTIEFWDFPPRNYFDLVNIFKILECGGNLFDAVSLAVKAALFNTRIPYVKAAIMDGGTIDLQLSDDPFDSKLLDVGSIPLLVTLCKIGDKCVVDPSAEEEGCSVISLVVGVTGNPKYYCSKANTISDVECKCSTISFNGPGSFAPKTFKDAINQGIIAAKCLDEALGSTLLCEEKDANGVKKKSYGFL